MVSVSSQQKKLGDALTTDQAALELYRKIGNPLGEANALGNIGLAYAGQGKLEDALELLEAARDIYL